jgi:peptidoglycan/LPS O-acetylase OafA/YrhL
VRIVALDVLRFSAAFAVVLFHYIARPEATAFRGFSDIAQFGYLGVPLFFMISGYVISLSAANRNAVQFAVARFVRLYPALWVGVLITSFVIIIFSEHQVTVGQILANFTLLNEYVGFDDIDGVYWTLKVELKFYACIFLILLFGYFEKYKVWLSIWLGITVTHHIFEQPFFMGWFINPTQSSFLIAGVALYLIQEQGRTKYNSFVLISSLLISCYVTYFQVDQFILNPGILERIIAVSLVVCFYIMMYSLSIGYWKIPANNALVTFGAITYPLYLIHNVAGKIIIDRYSNIIPESVLVILMVLLMVLLAFLIHYCVERPISTPMKRKLLHISDRAYKRISNRK